MLCSACATADKWKDQIDSSLATISTGLEKVKEGAAVASAKYEEFKAAAEVRFAEAKTELAAKGAPVEGALSEMFDWAKQNPFASLGSPGAIAAWILWRLLNAKKEAKTALQGLTASVDAADSLPPDALTAFKTAAAASSNMTPEVAALIAKVKAR